LFHTERVIAPFNYGRCFFTQEGEDRGAYDQPDIFEQGKVEEHEDYPENDTGQGKEESQPAVFQFLHPVANSTEFCEVFNYSGS